MRVITDILQVTEFANLSSFRNAYATSLASLTGGHRRTPDVRPALSCPKITRGRCAAAASRYASCRDISAIGRISPRTPAEARLICGGVSGNERQKISSTVLGPALAHRWHAPYGTPVISSILSPTKSGSLPRVVPKAAPLFLVQSGGNVKATTTLGIINLKITC